MAHGTDPVKTSSSVRSRRKPKKKKDSKKKGEPGPVPPQGEEKQSKLLAGFDQKAPPQGNHKTPHPAQRPNHKKHRTGQPTQRPKRSPVKTGPGAKKPRTIGSKRLPRTHNTPTRPPKENKGGKQKVSPYRKSKKNLNLSSGGQQMYLQRSLAPGSVPTDFR